MGVGPYRKILQVDTHVLLICQLTGVNGKVVHRVAVLVTPHHSLVTGIVRLHPRDHRLVVGDVVGDSAQSEFGVTAPLAE